MENGDCRTAKVGNTGMDDNVKQSSIQTPYIAFHFPYAVPN